MDLSKLVDLKILIDLGHFSTSTQMNHTSLSKPKACVIELPLYYASIKLAEDLNQGLADEPHKHYILFGSLSAIKSQITLLSLQKLKNHLTTFMTKQQKTTTLQGFFPSASFLLNQHYSDSKSTFLFISDLNLSKKVV